MKRSVRAAVLCAALVLSGCGKQEVFSEPVIIQETLPTATVPADGEAHDVTCKGTYTAADDQVLASADTVVATVGDRTLTNGELQVYYWMQVIDFLNQYYGYASMFGLDLAQPLDTQLCMDGSMTWQQHFLNAALTNWQNYQVMCIEADAADFVQDQYYVDYLEDLPLSLEETALTLGYESASAMLQADMGVGATLENYLAYLSDYYNGYMFYGSTLEALELTDAEIEAYFDEHAAEYEANGLEKTDERYVDVRHILIAPTSATGESTYTDEEWAAAEAKANDILNEWLTKNPDEDGFSVLAQAYSVDTGSASNGGLYQNVYVGQMVPEFNDWCFDETRQYGDYGIVKTSYGYHIMYFVQSNLVWKLTAQQDMLVEWGNNFLQEAMDKNPTEIDYSAIALAYVDLAAAG